MEQKILTYISLITGNLSNINNDFLKQSIMIGQKRMSDDLKHTRYEDFYLPESKEFKKIVEGIVYEYFKKFDKRLELLNYWAHVHNKFESTNTHHHFDTKDFEKSPEISGVYYVSTPKDCGKIVFIIPHNKYIEDRYEIEPKEGDYILFPSHLEHYVTKNLSDEKRISISFNMRTKK